MSAHDNLWGMMDVVLFRSAPMTNDWMQNDSGVCRPMVMVGRKIKCKKMVVKGNDIMHASHQEANIALLGRETCSSNGDGRVGSASMVPRKHLLSTLSFPCPPFKVGSLRQSNL